MKISAILKQRKKGFSFEFFPPKTDHGLASLAQTVALLKKYEPLYVSMTFGAGGGAQERTVNAVHMLLETGGLEVMPHLTGISMGVQEVARLLDDYTARDIENIMVLRGDPPVGTADFDFSHQEFKYACELLSFIRKRWNFCLGVAVYPEGHIETASLEEDTKYTKIKIDAGADFAVTQMFFDNTYFWRLLERMKKSRIAIPVVPGILPLTDVAKVKKFASVCRATIPRTIEARMERFRDAPADMQKAGLEFTIAQCRDLLRNGAQRLHFFTLNKPDIITTVLDAL